MNTCDLAIYILQYEDFIVELFGLFRLRYDKREVEIFTDKEVIIGDYLNKEIRYLKGNKNVKFDKNNDHYLKKK